MSYTEIVHELCEATGIERFRLLTLKGRESLIGPYFREYSDELGEMWFKRIYELSGIADQILWYVERNAEGASHYTEIGYLLETLMLEQLAEDTQRQMDIYWSEREQA